MLAFLKLIPIWAYVGLALGALLGVQTLRLHFAQSDLAVANASISVYKSTKATNLETIAKQKAALNAWAGKFHAGVANAQAQAKLAIASAIESANAAAAANTKLKVIYER